MEGIPLRENIFLTQPCTKIFRNTLSEALNKALRKALRKALNEAMYQASQIMRKHNMNLPCSGHFRPRITPDVYIISTQPNATSRFKSEPPQSKVSRGPCQLWVVVGPGAFNVGAKVVERQFMITHANIEGARTNNNTHSTRVSGNFWLGLSALTGHLHFHLHFHLYSHLLFQ